MFYTPQVEVNLTYSATVEAQALLVAIAKHDLGVYNDLNMNVIPYNSINRKHPYGIIIPRLDYSKVPNLVHTLREHISVGTGSFLSYKPSCLALIEQLIEHEYGSTVMPRFKYSKVDSLFNDLALDLQNIFGAPLFKTVTVYLMRFGTGTISAPVLKTPSNIFVSVREGVDLACIVSAVFDSIVHLKRSELKLAPAELRPIRDWLVSNSRVYSTLNKHKIKLMPSTTYMRKNTYDRLNKPDIKYLNELGLFKQKNSLTLINNTFFYNEKRLSNLTANEHKILTLLVSSSGKIVPLEDLLAVLEDTEKILSYYAVYKSIERLRKKLLECGLPSNIIKTVPKRGICLIL